MIKSAASAAHQLELAGVSSEAIAAISANPSAFSLLAGQPEALKAISGHWQAFTGLAGHPDAMKAILGDPESFGRVAPESHSFSDAASKANDAAMTKNAAAFKGLLTTAWR